MKYYIKVDEMDNIVALYESNLELEDAIKVSYEEYSNIQFAKYDYMFINGQITQGQKIERIEWVQERQGIGSQQEELQLLKNNIAKIMDHLRI